MPYFILDFNILGNPSVTVKDVSITCSSNGYKSNTSTYGIKTNDKKIIFFFGYSIIGSDCIFSSEELNDLPEINTRLFGNNGSYILVYQNGSEISIGNDFSGSTPIFYYNRPEGPVASNSLKLLINHLTSTGIKLEFNKDTLPIFLKRSTPSDQIFNPSTIINRINCLKWGHQIKIDLVNKKWAEAPNANTEHFNAPANYEDSIVKAAESIVSLMDLGATISNHVDLPLTGGHDSRVLYAASRHSGNPKINVYPVRQNIDRKIALKLLNLEKNINIPEAGKDTSKAPLSDLHARERWEMGNLGVYSFYEFSQVLPLHNDGIPVELRGGGGGHMRDFFDIEKINDLIDHDDLESLSLHKLSSQLSTTQKFYLAYRNRFHFGRTFTEIERLFWRIDPLNSWQVLNAINVAGIDRAAKHQIYLDLILLTYPPCALEEFDNKNKSFSKEAFYESPFFQNKKDVKITEWKIGNASSFTNAFKAEKGTGHWMDSAKFNQTLSDNIVDICRSSVPVEITGLDDVIDRFERKVDGKSSREWGREITKYYSIARLIETGVTLP